MVFKLLKSLVGSPKPLAVDTPFLDSTAPRNRVDAPGVAPFDLEASLIDANGFPLVDWPAAERWVSGVTGSRNQAAAWSACERAWIEHLCKAMGPAYHVRAQGSTILLSSLPGHVADVTLAFVNRTVQRIVRTLDGIAAVPEWGQDILIVFEDDEAYYRYVAHYYPEDGEFAASSGMYIQGGCGHFVTVKADLHAIEPIIAHELTHACLSHLPIPAWLNEGLAVNTELRLCPPPQAPENPRQRHDRHRSFWGPEEIQQFWSGKSFLRNDEGNELSYDLARILVSQLSTDWPRFRAFVLAAHLGDGGASAARDHLAIDLGGAACAVLEKNLETAWEPQPEAWRGEPERGAFRPLSQP